MIILQSRRVLKTIVITIVVAAALMAYGASASSTTPSSQTTPEPAVSVVPDQTTYHYLPTQYRLKNGSYLGLNRQPYQRDGYTETTTTLDQDGNKIKTRRKVDIDDDETTYTTTVVGPNGVISRTKTEIEAE